MKADQFDLIRGEFEADEAREVLLYLIDGKIQFHKKRIFSDRVRFGKENIDSKNRIKELETMREQILAIITDAPIAIHSQINLEILSKSEAA